MKKGYLAIILHAHLPYIRHLSDGDLEEEWLYEAIIETYIPLLNLLENLEAERVPVRIGISLTPPLLNMLEDKTLLKRFKKRLEVYLELADKEVKRTERTYPFNETAQLYKNNLLNVKAKFEFFQGDLIAPFKHFQSVGMVELLASAATHGYLPLMDLTPNCQKAQIVQGVSEYKRFFGVDPKGFWLPECGFSPGIDTFLAANGLRYFITDTHALLHANIKPRYANYAPIYTPGKVAAFGRDQESSKQVWSATEGYPGDYDYRDFYRDIGFDLDYEYLHFILEPVGSRKMTGFKYYKITSSSDYKEPYYPATARAKAKLHAANFVFNREAQVNYLATITDRPPILVAPYDAELFGHWWFEGPIFLEEVLRLAANSSVLELVTPKDYLEYHPTNQIAIPSASSWGYNGYNEVWLEGSNDWIYPHLHAAGWHLANLAAQKDLPQSKQRRLNQAARELLLAESSDWAFIMKTGTFADYARKRTKEHLANFWQLTTNLDQPLNDLVEKLEKLNPIFPEIDYRIFA